MYLAEADFNQQYNLHLPGWGEFFLVVAQVPLAHHVGAEAQVGEVSWQEGEGEGHLVNIFS